ncbi:MAG TPA: hypothetical protein VFQ85_10585 [Mycobacteriales bacterium]|nr:hypothetical protein [Mycobacteriales bacterium]
MRPLRVLAAALGAAPLALLLPAPAASAVLVVPCTALVTATSRHVGTTGTVVTATVEGHCRGTDWITCDVRIAGATGVLASNRDSGITNCVATVSMTGVAFTPYLAVGQTGYTDSYPAYVYSDATPVVG